MPVYIESSQNSIYKHIKKLQTKNGRSKNSQYLAEGVRAVGDAISNGADIEYVIIKKSFEISRDLSQCKVYVMEDSLFDSLKTTVNSQGILAVINYEIFSSDSMNADEFETVIYLDSVTDPGNMGTIIRSSDALGADAIIISKGCVDIFNPKVVRSSMASILNIPIFTDENPKDTFGMFKSAGFEIVGTFPDAKENSRDTSYGEKVVLVMGNEANGISEDVERLCTKRVTIPMMGRAESLNVATAMSIMLYEISVRKTKRIRGEM
ncbi:MAG: RNA methyltransferase [Ruminococcaceae bacterium]|nr:RNA methyltransferase [Oscillospiraceae bacterium]